MSETRFQAVDKPRLPANRELLGAGAQSAITLDYAARDRFAGAEWRVNGAESRGKRSTLVGNEPRRRWIVSEMMRPNGTDSYPVDNRHKLFASLLLL